MKKKIESFSGEYKFLSNFYSVDVQFEGVYYPSVEHAFQAAKTVDRRERGVIREAISAGAAKRLGKKVTLRPGWDELRVKVMKELVLQKFKDYPVLRKELLDTGDAELVEGNHWHDYFWGVCDGRGENMLGKILMEVRSELSKGTQ